MKRFVMISLCLLSACQAGELADVPQPSAVPLATPFPSLPPKANPTAKATPVPSTTPKPSPSASGFVSIGNPQPTLEPGVPLPTPTPTATPWPTPEPTPPTPKVNVTTLKFAENWPLGPGEKASFDGGLFKTYRVSDDHFYGSDFLDNQGYVTEYTLVSDQTWLKKRLYPFRLSGYFYILPDKSAFHSGPYQRDHEIYHYSPSGEETLFAGSTPGYKDGPALQAQFKETTGIVLDSKGNVFVADRGNARIRKISTDGMVSTVAGSGVRAAEDGPALQATILSPTSLAVDAQDNIYIVDAYSCIRKLTPQGQLSTFSGVCGQRGYGYGSPQNTKYSVIRDLIVGPDGTVYVSDGQYNAGGHNIIRQVSPEGIASDVTTALSSNCPEPRDFRCHADGPGDQALFNNPGLLSITKDGKTMFIGEPGYIRKLEFLEDETL